MAYVNCLTLRGIKGSALTHGELDNNFLCLDTAISSLNNYVSTGLGNRWFVPSGITVTVPNDFQTFIYGDLIVEGIIDTQENGQLVVLNGNLIMSGGSVVGSGTTFVIQLPDFDTKVSGFSFNNSTYDLTITQNDASTFTTNLGLLATDVKITGGTYDPNTGSATFYNNSGGSFTVTGFLTGFTDNYVTGGTYNNGTSSIDFVGTPYFPPFSVNLSQLKFTGNTSGDCITELHVSNLYGCSPITIHDNLQNTTSVASGLFVNVLGKNNTSSASNYSTIAGGEFNQIGPGTHSFIGGGVNNIIGGYGNFIGGGRINRIYFSDHSSILGGYDNYIYNNPIIPELGGNFSDSVIAGGKFNWINRNQKSFIGGGESNYVGYDPLRGLVQHKGAVIIGGFNNITKSLFGSVVGGSGNTSNGNYSFIGGGVGNANFGYASHSSVVGGKFNYNSGSNSFIGGGSGNRILEYPAYATIGGGWNNTTYAANSFIGGGRDNKLNPGYYTVIVGGSYNYIYSFAGNSSIVGGVNNIIGGYGNFIGGGRVNRITDSFASFIGGGRINRINGNYGFIGAGYNNFITSSSFSSIISGRNNKIVGSSGNTTNIHIIGSNITASTSNTTYVNNLRVEGLNNSQPKLSVYGSGTTSPLFLVQGSQGELFSVSDSLIGSLFSVNDISGLPILEVFSDNTILQGSFTAPSLNTTVKVNLSIGQNTIYSIPTSAYTGGFFDYTLSNTTGVRAGTVISVWSGTSAEYVDNATSDLGIGDTTPVTLSVAVSGSNALLLASATTANWVIKTIVRSI